MINPKVGDLVRYTHRNKDHLRMGIVTKVVNRKAIWWADADGRISWTHVSNLEVISESR